MSLVISAFDSWWSVEVLICVRTVRVDCWLDWVPLSQTLVIALVGFVLH